MNWFMRSTSRSEVEIWLRSSRGDCCDHVAADESTAYAVRGETDSFGPLERTVLCESCDRKIQQEEDDAVVVCHDCHKEKPSREVYQWRWYDFYAPQGDEPLLVCHDCWDQPRHVARRRRDAAEWREEVGLVECHDCHRDRFLREVTLWKGVDYSPRFGDEPLIICRDCWGKPPHVARRKRNAAKLGEELDE